MLRGCSGASLCAGDIFSAQNKDEIFTSMLFSLTCLYPILNFSLQIYAPWWLFARNPKRLISLVVSLRPRGDVHYGDVGDDGLLEAERLQRCRLCRGDPGLL